MSYIRSKWIRTITIPISTFFPFYPSGISVAIFHSSSWICFLFFVIGAIEPIVIDHLVTSLLRSIPHLQRNHRNRSRTKSIIVSNFNLVLPFIYRFDQSSLIRNHIIIPRHHWRSPGFWLFAARSSRSSLTIPMRFISNPSCLHLQRIHLKETEFSSLFSNLPCKISKPLYLVFDKTIFSDPSKPTRSNIRAKTMKIQLDCYLVVHSNVSL